MRWILLVLFWGCVGQAQAGCLAAVTTPVGFGTLASNTLRLGGQTTSTTQAGLTCSPVVVSLLGSGDHLYVTVAAGSGGMKSAAGDVVAYQLYADATTSNPITRGVRFDYASSPVSLAKFGLYGNANPGAPLFLSMIVGNDVPAGIYQETLTLNWSWDYCSTVLVLGACVPARDTGVAVSTLVVNLTVTNDCVISTTPIIFTAAPVVAGFSQVNASVFLACTKKTDYTVGLSDGGNPVAVGGRRRMIANGNFLAYDLFKSATNARWGSVGADRRASATADLNPGQGQGNVVHQRFDLNARIYTDQPTPPAGIYTDNVLLDVQF